MTKILRVVLMLVTLLAVGVMMLWFVATDTLQGMWDQWSYGIIFVGFIFAVFLFAFIVTTFLTLFDKEENKNERHTHRKCKTR